MSLIMLETHYRHKHSKKGFNDAIMDAFRKRLPTLCQPEEDILLGLKTLHYLLLIGMGVLLERAGKHLDTIKEGLVRISTSNQRRELSYLSI